MQRAALLIPQIERRLTRGEKLVVFLDFDGTLAPIVRDYTKAQMSKATSALVAACARRFPTYIVSGRSLTDLKTRAKIPRVSLAGNHGLERGTRVVLSEATQTDIKETLRLLAPLKKFHGARVEDKSLSVALHYRAVASADAVRIRAVALRVLRPTIARGRLEILQQKKVLDIRPRGSHKGDFVRAILARAGKNAFPLYVGDDQTDEDAFRVVKKSGYGIRVGRSKKSAARFYLANIAEVNRFLKKLTAPPEPKRAPKGR